MITTVTYQAGYKLSHNYNTLESTIGATATVEEGQTPEEAYRALKKQVRLWIRKDYAEGVELVKQLKPK